jgi:DNA-binding response OmpR family regulator
MASILIVDDEPEIVRGLEDNLRFEGYQTGPPPTATRRSRCARERADSSCST